MPDLQPLAHVLLVKSVSQDSGIRTRPAVGEKEKRAIEEEQGGALGPWLEVLRRDTLARVGNHERLLQLHHDIQREFELIKLLCGIKDTRPLTPDSEEEFCRCPQCRHPQQFRKRLIIVSNLEKGLIL